MKWKQNETFVDDNLIDETIAVINDHFLTYIKPLMEVLIAKQIDSLFILLNATKQ